MEELNRFINLIFLYIVNGIFTLAGIFLNAVVIISLWKYTQLRKGTGNFMILLLSSVDIVVVILAHPSNIMSALPWFNKDENSLHWRVRNEYHLAEIALTASHNAQVLSSCSLLAMTIDRYLAISRPLFHKVYVNKRRLLVSSFLIQILCVGTRVIRFVKVPKLLYHGVSFTLRSTVIIMLIFMNYKMFTIAVMARKKKEPSTTQLALLKRNSTCLLTVLCSFLFSFPLVIYTIFRVTETSLISEDSIMLLRLWAFTSSAINSTSNCVIFFLRNKILRKAGKKLLKSCCLRC